MPSQRPVSVVTGAGRGIGSATAAELARRGDRVVLIARSADQVESAAERIRREGGAARAVVADISSRDAVVDAFELIAAEVGQVSVLVNNAGAIVSKPLEDMTPQDLEHVLAPNVAGTYWCSQQAAMHMKGARGGAIVNVGSVFGGAGVSGYSAYSASKAAIVGLTRALAVELAPAAIRVNAIVAGHVATDMTADALADEETHARVVRRIPLRRVGAPEEVAAASAYLTSDRAAFVTGSTLTIDGGFLSQ